jgi:hypothetical protein
VGRIMRMGTAIISVTNSRMVTTRLNRFIDSPPQYLLDQMVAGLDSFYFRSTYSL